MHNSSLMAVEEEVSGWVAGAVDADAEWGNRIASEEVCDHCLIKVNDFGY